ncbi:hypothetical protein EMIT0324P_11536 [Pseudomonas chlororaphis]
MAPRPGPAVTATAFYNHSACDKDQRLSLALPTIETFPTALPLFLKQPRPIVFTSADFDQHRGSQP